ncbi:hypothetical protein F5J12DRAFT_270440 [Pisolithus orientalis]|uniref:uncharacterized protein n=1 Tax=Pisolithus orientalis TaxID=936130 RepID=UPI0022259AFC|nr:uncharacterized protein F5J12DRAFT_270440 [Pisolithus orientalis]KAI5999860.1 hypothetical protein F5J12DRAFT_270440 [Pisolithus orientalis]
MIPFIPTVALAFVSFITSAFVVLRIVIPILPPHPLSRRVRPSEFGLPNYNFRSLSTADKSHLWLASLDFLALCVFVWQATTEYFDGPVDVVEARDAASSARLWFALTIRQSCLLVVSGLTLLHIRMGRSVSFGARQWMIWAPTLLLGVTSTALAAVLSGAGVPSLFIGLVAYSGTTAVLSTAAFGGLVYTLVAIRRNLAALHEPADSWPPAKEVEEKPRHSFATEDVDILREGSSWLTSDAGSHRDEVASNWSFSTYHTHHGRFNPTGSQQTLAPRSSYWFSAPSPQDPSIPPVPPLPSPYRPSTSPTFVISEDPDPFRRDVPSRPRLGSQSSWLTSSAGTHPTISAWSFPATPHGESVVDVRAGLLPAAPGSRPATPAALSTAQVLGGYGYTADSEKGIESLATKGSGVDISYSRYVFWLLSIWVPTALSLPYFILLSVPGSVPSDSLSLLLVLSVTLSSPLLAINILLRSPIPIPTGLFDVHAKPPPAAVLRAPSPADTLATYTRDYKRSGSVTIVEGRRSGDVWISQGDAIDGKGKVGRALGLMSPVPRLAVLPIDDEKDEGERTPPLPLQEEPSFPSTLPLTPASTNSAELGRSRKESKSSSHLSTGEEAFASRIMIAQRHYSALATTVVVPASPDKQEELADGVVSVATGVAVESAAAPGAASHLRSRSVSSVIGQAITTEDLDISPPPSDPLPPTPPNIRNAKLAKQLMHKKSYSSGFSLGAVGSEDMKEIDALTAGVLPLLVPGLKVGEDMKIKDWEFSPPLSSTVAKKSRRAPKGSHGSDFGVLAREEFSSPQLHSTPAQERRRGRKVSAHRRNHFSLPSLGLGKDALQAWKSEVNHALATKIHQYSTLPVNDAARRNTVWGDESVPNLIARPRVGEDQLQVPTGASLGRSLSTRTLGLRPEVPHGVDSARTSVITLTSDRVVPPSAASTVTLFEPESTFDPDAQSTPYDTQKGYPYTRKYQAAVMPRSNSRRSSIVYIKSSDDEYTRPESVTALTTNSNDVPSSEPAPPVSTRAVRPLVPKSSTNSKLQRKTTTSSSETNSPGGGLRPLSLLKDRDQNTTTKDAGESKVGASGTRPLLLGKKRSKAKVAQDADSENVNPVSSGNNKHLKPLQLHRSESSRIRGLLRKAEAVPTVVVRPPSDQLGTLYEYR